MTSRRMQETETIHCFWGRELGGGDRVGDRDGRKHFSYMHLLNFEQSAFMAYPERVNFGIFKKSGYSIAYIFK